MINLGAGHAAFAVSSGGSHTCSILDNADLKCWGRGTYGSLGYDSTDNKGDETGEMASLGVVNLGVGRTAVAVSAGDRHTCSVLDNAELKCWGQSSNGQLRPAMATFGVACRWQPWQKNLLWSLELGPGSAGPWPMSSQPLGIPAC